MTLGAASSNHTPTLEAFRGCLVQAFPARPLKAKWHTPLGRMCRSGRRPQPDVTGLISELLANDKNIYEHSTKH